MLNCEIHNIKLNSKNNCKSCQRNERMKIYRKNNKNSINIYENFRKKPKIYTMFGDIETTVDKTLNSFTVEYDRNFNVIRKSTINDVLDNNKIEKPQPYLITIVVGKEFGSIKDKFISNSNEYLFERLKETKYFNETFTEFKENENLSNYSYAFYNKHDFILFLINYCENSEIWFHNGAKFDFIFIRSMFIDFGFEEKIKNNLIDELKKVNIDELNEIGLEEYEKLKKKWNDLNNSFLEKISNDPDKFDLSLKKAEEMYQNNKITNKLWDQLYNHDFTLETLRDGKKRILTFDVKTDRTFDSKVNNKRVQKHCKIKFRDSALLFQTTIKQIGFDLEGYFKNTIKNSKEVFNKQEINHNKYELFKTNEEMLNYLNGKVYRYGIQDTFILFAFFVCLNENGVNKNDLQLTAGATALREFYYFFGKKCIEKTKEIEKLLGKACNINVYLKIKKIKINEGFYNYEITFKRGWSIEIKKYTTLKNGISKLGKYIFSIICPSKLIEKEIREWYFGGLTSVNEKFRGKLVIGAIYVDVNSSYPSVMNSNTLCPIGKSFKGDENGNDYKLIKLTVLKDIINDKGLPFVTNRKIIGKNANYLKKLSKNNVIYLDSNEYKRFKKYYSDKESIDYVKEVMFSFRAIKMKELFGDFVEYFYKIKEEASKNNNLGLKTWAKLILNCLYGKFGTKFEIEKAIQTDRHVFDFEDDNKRYYLPIGVAITAGARMILVDCCEYNYEKWIYNDSDSGILLTDNLKRDFPNVIIDKDKMGCLKKEAENLVGIARRAKQYKFINYKTGQIKSAFAGYRQGIYEIEEDDEEELTELEKEQDLEIWFEDLILGKIIKGNITKKQTPEFVQIYNTDKILKPVCEFVPHPEQIYGENDFLKTLESIKKFEKNFFEENNIEWKEFVRNRNK